MYVGAREEAERELQKLLAGGQKEATELNEEYKRLVTQAKDALQALADFEEKKLGMRHKESREA